MQPFKYRPRLNAGNLNRRIKIQELQTTTDAEGVTKKAWVDKFTPWASRKPLTARWRETFQAAGLSAEKMVKFEVRYRPGVHESMRIVDGKKIIDDQEVERIYDIKAVLDDVYGDRTETWIMALERENG